MELKAGKSLSTFERKREEERKKRNDAISERNSNTQVVDSEAWLKKQKPPKQVVEMNQWLVRVVSQILMTRVQWKTSQVNLKNKYIHPPKQTKSDPQNNPPQKKTFQKDTVLLGKH